MGDEELVVLASLLAGVAGTGLGGILGALLGAENRSVACYMLAFAGGVMAGISLFAMLPASAQGFRETTGSANLLAAVGATAWGAFTVFAVEKLYDVFARNRGAEPLSVCLSVVPSGNPPEIKPLLRAGFAVALAVTGHTLPGGLAIGAAGSAGAAGGMAVAVAIALHNVPEGMAIAAPLAGGGKGKIKAALIAAAAGAATVPGAAVGLTIGKMSPVANAVSLAFAAGAMLYVPFADIFAEAYASEKKNATALCALSGALVAVVFGGI